ncbi:MAG TPA: PEP-CTERM sorting domain-containing protein [Tepidisphaeraceae bacterium]|nr:PEP-CTERM sorting domain-containing protein [Tepidisphaeraceae bacterium]
MRSIRAGAAVLALTVAGGAASPARAAFVAEYFNNIGTTGAPLFGFSGWQGTTNSTTYVAGTQVIYTAPGYSAAGNESDANDGAASGSNTGNIVYRSTGAMTGTVWISAVVNQTAINSDVLLWLDKTNTNANGVDRDFAALRGSTGTTGTSSPPEALIAYDGADDGGDTTDFAINTPHLILLKIDLNHSALLDRITYWVDPDLSGGEAGLGMAVGNPNGPKYVKSTVDAYGNTFDGVGLTFRDTASTLDALRVSNDADGFVWVTTGVPEPTTAALLGVAAVGLCARRRRR